MLGLRPRLVSSLARLSNPHAALGRGRVGVCRNGLPSSARKVSIASPRSAPPERVLHDRGYVLTTEEVAADLVDREHADADQSRWSRSGQGYRTNACNHATAPRGNRTTAEGRESRACCGCARQSAGLGRCDSSTVDHARVRHACGNPHACSTTREVSVEVIHRVPFVQAAAPCSADPRTLGSLWSWRHRRRRPRRRGRELPPSASPVIASPGRA